MAVQSLTVAGRLASEADITLPYAGTWIAHVTVEGVAALPSAAFGTTIVVGALSLVGTVVDQGPFGAGTRVRIVGGGNGWARRIPARAYQSGGVAIRTLVSDAAAEVGERIGRIDGGSYGGSHYVRPAGKATDVLTRLRYDAGLTWWVGTDGATYALPARPETRIRGGYALESRDADGGAWTLVPDLPGEWMPGASFVPKLVPGTFTVSTSRIRCEVDGTIRVSILST
jgi:hypothetical protein